MNINIYYSGISLFSKLFLASIAVYIFLVSLIAIYKFYVPVLYWDQWDDIGHYINFYNGNFNFTQLFEQHNEHRIFFPRLIFFADFYFFKGTGFSIIVLTLIMQTMHAVILSLLYKATNSSQHKIFYALSLATILMLSLGQEDNFISAFQIEFVGVGLASTLAFVSFIKALGRMKNGLSYWPYELCSYIACAIATFSLANGILSAFILTVIAIALRSSFSVILRSIFIFTALFIGYFLNFHAPGERGHFLDSLIYPVLYFQYVFNYLGNIFNILLGASDAGLQTLLGSIGFIATLFGFWRLVSRQERNLARAALLSVTFFAAGTAMLTSLGRVGLGLAQANDERYLTPIFIFWLAHIFYWCSYLSEFKRAKYYFIPLHMLSLGIIVAAIQAHIAGLQILKTHSGSLEYASTALMSEVEAPETFKNLHPFPQRVIEVSSFLRDHGLSIFSTREAKSLGHPITDTYRISDSTACSGSIDEITGQPPYISPPNWVANGQAWNNLKNKAVDQVILTSQSDVVIGFAAGGPHFSNFFDVLIGLPESKSVWRGFLKAPGNGSILAYALLADGSVCRFGHGVFEKVYTGRGDELGLLREVQATATPALSTETEDNHLILFAHAPSILSVNIPDVAHRLHFAFGFKSAAWQTGNPEPAQFSIKTEDSQGHINELWRRELNPMTQEKDRGRQEASIDMPAGFTGKILLSITPVANANYLWTYWSAMSFDYR